MKRTLTVLLLALLSGCASVHPGHLATSTSSLPLKISGRAVDRESGDPFQLVEMTFENTGTDWLRIDKAHVVMDEKTNPKVSVVVGKDLSDWALAMQKRSELQQQRAKATKWWIAGLGLASYIAGAGTDRSELLLVGSGAIATSYALAIKDTIGNSVEGAQRSGQLPESHLHHEVSIPGKLFSRRWVVLNLPTNQRLRNLELELETVEGEKAVYDIAL